LPICTRCTRSVIEPFRSIAFRVVTGEALPLVDVDVEGDSSIPSSDGSIAGLTGGNDALCVDVAPCGAFSACGRVEARRGGSAGRFNAYVRDDRTASPAHGVSGCTSRSGST